MLQLFFLGSIVSLSVLSLVSIWVKDMYEWEEADSGIPHDPTARSQFLHVALKADWLRTLTANAGVFVVIYFLIAGCLYISGELCLYDPVKYGSIVRLFIEAGSFFLVLSAAGIAWWSCKIRQKTAMIHIGR